MAAEAAALAAIAFLGALVFGITGFGSALITIPLATHLVPLGFALALFALVDLCSALSVGLENPRNAVRAAGMFLLGLFVLSYALYSLVRHAPSHAISARWAWLAGLAGGITSTLFGAGGPPYAIYLSQRGLTKEQFRATMGFATMTSISLRVAAFAITGLLLDPAVWLTALVVVPAGLLGLFVARRLYRRISRELLMRVVAVVLLASGSSLVLRALH